MAQKNSHNNQDQGGFDIVEPFILLFTEVFKLILQMLEMLARFVIQKFIAWYMETRQGRYVNKPLVARQLRSKKQAQGIEFLGLSLNRKRPFRYEELNTKRHTGVIGSTGSGKSVCLENLMMNALSRGLPVIYFDPKPSVEGVRRFNKMAKAFNKQALIVGDEFFSEALFNPLLEGSAHEITNRLMNALEWSESFYKNESQRVLFEAIRQCETDKAPVTLENILSKLTSHHDRKTVAGLLSQLTALNHSEFKDHLNASSLTSIGYRQIRLEGQCVYIGFPAMGKGSVGMAINKLFFGGILYHSKESFNGMIPGLSDPLANPISVVFDELASTVHEGFIDLLSKCRSAGIEVTFATQSPSDIERVVPGMTDQVFENTNNVFLFNQVVPKHTEYFAKLIGTCRTIKRTYQIDEGQRSERGSEREVEEFIAHANIIRGLGIGQCIFFQRDPKRVDLLKVKLPHYPDVLPERSLQSAASVI